eukprot:9322121-Karenia_brevis.AAC.1
MVVVVAVLSSSLSFTCITSCRPFLHMCKFENDEDDDEMKMMIHPCRPIETDVTTMMTTTM